MSAKKKIIGIDLDDVLLDFNNGLLNYHNQCYGTAFNRDHVNNYDLSRVWGITKEEAIKRVFDFYETDLHFNALPVEGGVKAIQKLSMNSELVIITAKPDKYREHTLRWINTHFSNNCFNEIIFTNQYHGDGPKITKSEVCKKLGVEIFIDDNIENINEVAQIGVKSLLFDAPWNQKEFSNENIVRVYSWEEIVTKIAKFNII